MTQVNWGRPLILAVILVILASTAYWLQYSHKPKTEEAKEQEKKPFHLKDNPTASIRLIDGKKVFAFHCLDLATHLCKPGDNSKWEMTEPLKARADDSNVNSLVSTLNHLSATDVISLKEETQEKRAALLKEYHLDSSSRKGGNPKRIEVIDSKNKTLVLLLGEKHPINQDFFAAQGTGGDQFDETRVLLIPTYVKSNFEKDLTYWRDKKLFTLASHQVQKFTLEGSKAHVSGERKDGQWILHSTQQGELSGDIENVDNLLSAATYLSAKAFPEKSSLRGAKKVLTLTLGQEKQTPITLTLLEKKSKASTTLYATVSNVDPLFELESTVKDRLDKSIKDLRLSKLITSMERFSVKQMNFEGAALGEPLKLSQTHAKWVDESGKQDISNEKVQNLLDKLSGNRIQDFLASSKTPAGEEAGLKVSFASDAKSPPMRQLLFWKKDHHFYAQDLNSKRKETYLVDSAIEAALPWNRNFFDKTQPSPTQVPSPVKK